jgi:hypothetical protein
MEQLESICPTVYDELPRRENKGLSQLSKDGFQPVSLQNDDNLSKDDGES